MNDKYDRLKITLMLNFSLQSIIKNNIQFLIKRANRPSASIQEYSFCKEYIERLIFFYDALFDIHIWDYAWHESSASSVWTCLYVYSAPIVSTKYEAARRSTTEITILWKKYREVYENLQAAGHHPSSRSHKGKVFRVNEFLSQAVSGEMRGKFLRVNRSLSWIQKTRKTGTEKGAVEILIFCADANNAGCICTRAKAKSSIVKIILPSICRFCKQRL